MAAYMYEPQHKANAADEPRLVGSNYIFLCIIPYAVATGMQDTNTSAACLAGMSAAGGILVLGMIFRFFGGRRIWPYILEVALLAVFVTQYVVTIVRGGEFVYYIWRYFPFITNSALAGITLATILVGYPFTIQNVREAVTRAEWRHPAVPPAAYLTTGVWLLVFILNTLMYLIPFISGKDYDHWSAANLTCRLILPPILFAAAALFTRYFPMRVEAHLERSAMFDATPKRFMVNQVHATPDYV